eukprot:TRINITY_DN11412_c0_g1_i1.p1 TRINITY_DN11412_c0_g1~~TRINITY_DN11412_c0_g1_i1.p1  ORF type:complete len:295 (-),score=73.44 TRINITY_DN11412_c0_g1_i1:17-901(-)
MLGRTVFITGASRGIGKAIAEKFAGLGANIVIAAKSEQEDSRLPGTIYSAAEEIKTKCQGGDVLPIRCDIRSDDDIQNAVSKTIDRFGGIDIVVNNASALFTKPVLETPMKRYDLVNQINARGTFATTSACLPHLINSAKKNNNPHVLVLSPPLNMSAKWFNKKVGYSIAKYGMSMCVLGMAEEFKEYEIGVNALWPRTLIGTAAVQNLLGGDRAMNQSRRPEIVADAAWYIVRSPGSVCTGNFFIDDLVLEKVGYSEEDFDQYSFVPGNKDFLPDFFVEDGNGEDVVGLITGK